MKKHLFLFSITPVQSFISQARKTRDLFSGSQLLSDLTDKAIEFTKESAGYSKEEDIIIFPHKDVENKPNRFVAEIEVENKEKINEIGNYVTEKLKEHFHSVADGIFNKKFGVKRKPEFFDEQIENFLFLYWTAVELDNDSNYTEKYRQLETSLGSVKNLKMFKQTNETGNRKCSLCGERNALFYGNENSMPAYYQKDAIKNVNDLAENEGLCAVCFTKRFYKEQSFPSTAHISVMNIEDKIKNWNEYVEYKEHFKGQFDHQLLYEENLTKKYFKKQKITSQLNGAQNKYYKLKEKITKEKLGSFIKYYALMMFDGDSMGKWLSGENINEGYNLKEFHSTLSKSVGEFSKSVGSPNKNDGILKEPFGKVIFSGGEDFMGFINLTSLFDIARNLREAYDEKINKNLIDIKKGNKNLTFSAGIVIAHYKMPLSEVIKWARKLEKNAKEFSDEKNAFSLAVLKHSGEIHQATFQWGTLDELTKAWDQLEIITNGMVNKEFSNTFITNLNKEFYLLRNELKEEKNEEKRIHEILKLEIKRLVSNSFMLKKKADETKEEFQQKKKMLKEKMEDALYNLLNFSEVENIDNFFAALNIADFIHRKIEGAE